MQSVGQASVGLFFLLNIAHVDAYLCRGLTNFTVLSKIFIMYTSSIGIGSVKYQNNMMHGNNHVDIGRISSRSSGCKSAH